MFFKKKKEKRIWLICFIKKNWLNLLSIVWSEQILEILTNNVWSFSKRSSSKCRQSLKVSEYKLSFNKSEETIVYSAKQLNDIFWK